jgi:hypothetical protein
MRRRAQLHQAEAARLRDDLLHHLWTKFPLHCVTLGEAQARVCVEHIIDRGQVHGFTSIATLRGYANLMLFLGSDFDDDPQLPWAAVQLRRSQSLARPQALAELLSLAGSELTRIAGARGEHYRRALLWVRSKRFDQLCASYGQDGELGLRASLRATWSQKYDVMGDAGITQLVADARLRAGIHGLLTDESLLVYSNLMLLLGSAFESDPFHPWAALALAEASQDPRNPAGQLHAAAVRELERFLILDRLRQSA